MISTRNILEGAIDGQQAMAEAPVGRTVPKPVPEAQALDPRKYQINQLKRRYSPRLNTLQNGTTNVSFHLKPSDPDFPFELDYLDCELQIPRSYPKEPPVLRVKNKDIPRGFSINIERGWDGLVRAKAGTTLLALTNALDKNLEAFLSEQKADTITILAFKDTRHLNDTTAKPEPKPEAAKPAPSKPYIPEESFTNDQIADAKARRAQEVRQLESRMGRMPHFHKSADLIVFTLPLQPKRRMELPVSLQSVQSLQLIIPLLYPLQPLKILLNEVESKDAEALEEAFTAKAAQQSQMTLMSHLNYLTQNIHILAKAVQPPVTTSKTPDGPAAEQNGKQSATKISANDNDKSHIKVVPRPPEWIFVEHSDDSDEDESWDEDDSDNGGATVTLAEADDHVGAQQVERGTSISFPSVELHGIELLQVTVLSINVKCERCRTINEITGLTANVEKASSCKKCVTPFTAKFRPEMVHQNSIRAGFVDVTNCTVADMLPSTFVPTCGRCSTPSQGLVSVRGEVTTNVCRECHGKFTFKIPGVKFLAIIHGGALPPTGPRRRQEKLGLHTGEPLPDRGSCSHYKKSYRWFRFSCCSKVYPCDKCHDGSEDHVNEWANRMICGWCSREQNYAVEACTFCGRSVIGRKGRGFWEGGRGTRDKTVMSRKDPRKFRRVGGSEAKNKD